MIFKKKFFVVICYVFCCVLILTKNTYADFFSTCGISNNDLDNIEYVLKNSNSKFIPHQIDEIQNETFKQALYLLSFHQDGENLPDDMIEVIGLDVIEQIPRFKPCLLNYFLKRKFYNRFSEKTEYPFDEKYEDTKKFFKKIKLTTDDYLFILKNKYFTLNSDNENYIKYFLFKVFFKKNLSLQDINFLRKKYSFYDDDYILQQIRLRLWDKKITDLHELKQLIKDRKKINHITKLEEFYKLFHNQTNQTISNKNNKLNKYKPNKVSDKRKIEICNKWIGYDEYIDLLCLKPFKKNTKITEKILANNLNASFLPEKWLFYRVYFVREMIENKNLTDRVYDIISNGDLLYDDSSYYQQQFLSGFVAFLLKNYDNSVTHFKSCIDVSKFAEYKARAYYWLGLSYRHLDDKIESKNAFLEAKKNIFAMYGQLAAEEVNEDPKENIKEYIISFNEQPEILCNDINFVLGYLEQYKRKSIYLSPILLSYITEYTDKTKLFNALIVVKSDFEKTSADIFSHQSFRFNVIDNDINFPIIKYTDDSLVNAIIKKESNFKHGLIGKAGECGIMQIMPSTGRILAKNMKIDFNQKRLLFDNEYNVNFGKYYINNLLQKFDENPILALASYNAGSRNVEKWISNHGDIRKISSNEEMVKWIEKIPFSYTRDYVTNILGFKMVYDVIKTIDF